MLAFRTCSDAQDRVVDKTDNERKSKPRESLREFRCCDDERPCQHGGQHPRPSDPECTDERQVNDTHTPVTMRSLLCLNPSAFAVSVKPRIKAYYVFIVSFFVFDRSE